MATLDRGENALLSGNEYKVVVIGKLHVGVRIGREREGERERERGRERERKRERVRGRGRKRERERVRGRGRERERLTDPEREQR